MGDKPDRKLKVVKEACPSGARTAGGVLSELYKAFKVLGFYPKGHPLLAESIQHAHRVMGQLLQAGDLSLAVSRTGFSLAGGGALDGTPMSVALAEELFIRRVQRITFLADLTIQDIERFLQLLMVDPRKFAAAGGMEELMKRRGITTIWANELDMAAILAKRAALEATGAPDGWTEQETLLAAGGESGLAASDATAVPQAAEAELREIIQLMDNEFEDQRYMQLAELVTALAEKRRDQGLCQPLAPVLFALLGHFQEGSRSERQRQYAHSAMTQIAVGEMLQYLLTLPDQREFQESEKLCQLLVSLGAAVIQPVIARLSESESLYARKFLANTLVCIGEPAVPFLTSMLNDDRWYVVRNTVAILGEIGLREAVKALKGAAYHADSRVRKEAIRSLAKLGGAEAEAVLIGLLTTRDKDVRIQAIFSLGVMKSQLALQPLLDIVAERDFFMDRTEEKREALQAVGRIGDRRATQFLLDFVTRRRWFTWKRMDELKIAAIQAVSQLGDETAVGILRHIAEKRGALAVTCKEALEALERVTD